MRKFAMVLLLLCLMLPLCASAAGIEDLWVRCDLPVEDADADPTRGDIHWWYSQKDKTYYIFLPAFSTPLRTALYYTGEGEVAIEGHPIPNGQHIMMEPGLKFTLTCGRKEYPLQVLQSAGVPAAFIRTASGSVEDIHASKENEETGDMILINADGTLAYNGDLTQIKGRGNATFSYNKKPYQIKLAEKTDLYGMGKHKTWILLANYHDNSLLRNTLTFDMARQAGLQYTPQSTFCDVYINNEYSGTYELCTKVQPDETRVAIPDLEDLTQEVNEDKLENYERFGKVAPVKGKTKGRMIPNDPEDITGGYILELEYSARYRQEASGYTTLKGQPIVVKYPEYASENQMAFISSLLQSFENAIRAKDGIDPDTGKHYSDIMDMDSFVKKYLLEEIVRNYDGNNSSQFFYKPVDSVSEKLFAGPAWDYDSSYGNYEGANVKNISGKGFAVCNDYEQNYFFFPAAYRQEDFRRQVQETYANVYLPILNTLLGQGEKLEYVQSIDEYAAQVEASAAMNFKRWPVFNIPARPVKTGADYQENIDYIKNFLTTRMAFLEEEWLIPYQNGEVCDKP